METSQQIKISYRHARSDQIVIIFQISPANFGLDLEYWSKGKQSEEVSFYRKFMIDVVTLFKKCAENCNKQEIYQDMNRVFYFEQKLAQVR